MSGFELIITFGVALAIGFAVGRWSNTVVVKAITSVCKQLNQQVEDREDMIAARDQRSNKLFIAIGDKMGLPADPNLGPPTTISRNRKKVAGMVQARNQSEEAARVREKHRPSILGDL